MKKTVEEKNWGKGIWIGGETDLENQTPINDHEQIGTEVSYTDAAITIPRASPVISTVNLSSLWAFCILIFAEGRRFVGIFAIFEVSSQLQELATDNTFAVYSVLP